jgi:formylglycine-generating enzyme required for sulfatase activity
MTANEHESEPSGQALPSGTRIEEFVIERVLGSGGFGITYLARDTALGRKVVIKENLPAQFAYRETTSLMVRPRHSGSDAADFAWSLENFSKEAAMLASLDHPGIVRVHRSFQALGTAYFVMPFVDGMAFDSLIESHKAKNRHFDEAGLRGLLTRMLDALGYLHDRGIYHRDIKPANILITNDGVPVLIDFGSARQRLSERSMTVVESAGYTPFEQLQSRGNVGPWSDLYALGGTLVKAITFESMPKAADRVFNDPYMPLAGRAELLTAYGNGLLVSVDKALAVQSQNRHRDAGEWVVALRGDVSVRVPASAPPPPASLTPVSEGFALIPAGEFQMGDALDGMKEAPVHTVDVSEFFMSKHAITKEVWDAVRAWGLSHGYTDLAIGAGKAANHPVQTVSWYDVVKWCNAKSEQEGLLPCYLVGGKVYRTGKCDATVTVVCDWTVNGYRLPTEAEWEKAARGGLSGKRFPWGDTISHDEANFRNTGHGESKHYQTGTTGYHPTYSTEENPYTSPVGNFAANGYGLYDMSGNVWEWCWDRYGSYVSMPQTDPLGHAYGSFRVYRGGSWVSDAGFCRIAYRNSYSPSCTDNNNGFRVVRSFVP